MKNKTPHVYLKQTDNLCIYDSKYDSNFDLKNQERVTISKKQIVKLDDIQDAYYDWILTLNQTLYQRYNFLYFNNLRVNYIYINKCHPLIRFKNNNFLGIFSFREMKEISLDELNLPKEAIEMLILDGVQF